MPGELRECGSPGSMFPRFHFASDAACRQRSIFAAYTLSKGTNRIVADMTMTNAEAVRFAEHHVAVWNTHDLDRIVDLYAEDAELHSPLAATLTGGGAIVGREALRRYFASALERYPALRFQLIDTLVGTNSVTLYFRGAGERLVAEVLVLSANDARIQKVFAHYSCDG